MKAPKSHPDNNNGLETSVTQALVIQRHGGALQVGNAGNKGSIGTPPSVVRARCRESFYDRVNFLERVADGMETVEVPVTSGRGPERTTILIEVPPSLSDRLKAMDLLGKYGAIEKVEAAEDRQGKDTQMTAADSIATILRVADQLRALDEASRTLSGAGPSTHRGFGDAND